MIIPIFTFLLVVQSLSGWVETKESKAFRDCMFNEAYLNLDPVETADTAVKVLLETVLDKCDKEIDALLDIIEKYEGNDGFSPEEARALRLAGIKVQIKEFIILAKDKLGAH